MKRILLAALLAVAAVPAFASVGVSVSVGQPGFYGQIDLGDAPPPQVIYAQPMVIERSYVPAEPIYLRVPPGHAKHWNKHCREYNACGRPVYFVREGWYSQQYVPYYRDHHGGGRGYDDRGDDHGHGRGDDREHGHGHGHGHGHDHDD